MRKLCWGCVAAALAAFAVLQVTRYAWNHPDEFLGRCAIGAYEASQRVGLIYRVGTLLADHATSPSEASTEELDYVPEDPEPIAVQDDQPSQVELEKTSEPKEPDPNAGRLPGKIVIEDGQEPPLPAEEKPAREPSVERMVKRIEEQWWSDDAEALQPAARTMPYCEDDRTAALVAMPYADEPAPAPRRHKKPELWNPFPPKGTEVGGDEDQKPGPDGKDCREDPSAALQIPGCPQPNKIAPGGEEASEPPQPERKKMKRADPPKPKKGLDESKLLPFAAPIKLDTMEFRPSDWGKDDVALPPF